MKNQVFKKLMAYLLVGTLVLSTPLAASASVSDFLRAYGINVDRDKREESGEDLWTGFGTDFWTNGWTGNKTSVETVADKLQALINACKELEEDAYSVKTWKNFSQALTAAETLGKDADADADKLKDAGDKLNKARKALVEVTELKEKIAEAKGYLEKTAVYTPESLEVLSQAIKSAEDVVKNAESDLDVQVAVGSLNDAIKGLDEIASEETTWEKLQKLISDCEKKATDADTYTQTSRDALTAEIKKAKDVEADADETAIKKAMDDLNVAVEELVNHSELRELIAEYEKLTNDNNKYPNASWNAFQIALKKAKDLYKRQDGTQEEINNEVKALRDARVALDKTEPEETAWEKLQKLISDCEKKATDADTYTQASREKLEAEIKKAKDVEADADKTAIKKAMDDLNVAVEELVNHSELRELIAEYEKLTNDNNEYTKASWDAFQAALTKARNLFDRQNGTQEEINNEVKALKDARVALDKSEPGTVDKTALKELIDICKKLNPEAYRKKIWDSFAEVLKKAEKVYEDKDATPKQVEKAYNDLMDAYGALQKTGFKTGTELIDEVIQKHDSEIIGISLDKEAVELGVKQEEGLKARVLFDDYNSGNEELDWAINSETRVEIESSIKWYTDRPDVVGIPKDAKGTSVVVEGLSDGQAEVKAWIENDGKKIDRLNTVPTEGDYVAKAVITVKDEVVSVSFDGTKETFVKANGYDLREYTNVELKSGKKVSAIDIQTPITYSIKSLPSGVKATVTNDGFFKITKGDTGTIVINMVPEKGKAATGEISVSPQNKVKDLTVNIPQSVDMGKMKYYVGDKDGNGRIQVPATLTATATNNNSKWTDNEFIWTVNNKKLVEILPDKADKEKGTVKGETATIVVKGLGKAKITAKAISGKKSKPVTMEIIATPDRVEIVKPEDTYTGKPVTLKATLRGENNMEIPSSSKSKIKWSLTNKSEDGLYASVNSKGIVTPKNILYGKKGNNKADKSTVLDEVTIKVTAAVGNNTSDKLKKTCDVKITQSNVTEANIIWNPKGFSTDEDGQPLALKTFDKNASVSLKGMDQKIYVGQNYWFRASLKGTIGDKKVDLSDSVAWAYTGKGIDASVNGKQLDAMITGTSNATLKASYIVIKSGTNKTAKKITKTIKINKPVQAAKKITFKQNELVVYESSAAQKVTVAVKATEPKKATYKIKEWKAIAYIKDSDGKEPTNPKQKLELGSTLGKKSIKVPIPANAKAGSVIKVAAYTENGIVEYAYIYVTEKTQKVKTNLDRTCELSLGESKNIVTTIETLQTPAGKTANEPKLLGETTKRYEVEPVSYTVDKKGASVIKIDANGKVTALKPGKAKVTVKAIKGRKTTITFTVKDDLSK